MPQAKCGRGDFVRRYGLKWTAAVFTLLFVSGPIIANRDVGLQQGGQAAAAIFASEKGTLLVRNAGAKAWQVCAARSKLSVGDSLLALPGMTAEVESAKNPALKLKFVANLPGLYRTTSLESEVRLNDAKDVDLDFTLERGRVVLVHAGQKGMSLRCRIRFEKEYWVLDLAEPGTRVGLAAVSRRLPWTDFPKKPDSKLQPTMELAIIVLEGSVDVLESTMRQTLGPKSQYLWRSDIRSGDVNILERLPADMTPAADATARNLLAAVKTLQGRLATTSPESTLSAALADMDASVRTAAVYGLASIGDVSQVLKSLEDAKNPEVRQAALLALRHWLGENYDNDQRLFDALLANKWSKTPAEIAVQLLHSFSPRQLALPETYESLIAFLTNDRLAIRQLAAWHLQRLVPDGDRIAYDPAGTAAQLREGQARWRKRIPEGKLPSVNPK
jgi:hypothetical protein